MLRGCLRSVGVVEVMGFLRRDKDHEHRRAAGDRDDSRPGSGAGAGDDPSRSTSFGSVQLHGDLSQGFSWALTAPKVASVPEALPERDGDMPILAWKRAQIAWSLGGGYLFDGIGAGGRYGADAVATCHSPAWTIDTSRFWEPAIPVRNHSAPALECRCGFYALTDPPSRNRLHFLLSVELFGRVIVHEKGCRAEKQRVLQVTAPTQCTFCREAVTTFVIPGGYRLDHDQPMMAARCAAHVHPDDVPVSAEALSRELGVPVVV